MKRSRSVILCLALLLLAAGCGNPFASPGEKLFRQAQRLEKKTEYFKAFDLYIQAARDLRREGKANKVDKCRYALTKLAKINMTYPLSAEAVREMIKKKYPTVTDQRINEVIRDGRLPHMKIGNKTYYFVDFLNTLYHIYPDFRTIEEAGALGKVAKLFNAMSKFIYEKDKARPGQTLVNPYRYLADGRITLKRKDLPERGLLKVWLPLPLVTAAQPQVEILDLYPRQYVKYPIQMDGDIGIAYMEIPLEEIKGDLAIGTRFRFTHYEERMKVDPDKIGEYDKDSPLYKRYTTPGRNIAVTSAIRRTARKLAGKETNPYRIAKRFYDHIVWDLDYSYTPHAALEALNMPESVYVYEHGFGDCGAQSMYFAALCRSVGIPARAAGGMQLFPLSTTGCGDHFWAEVYLPNYGWLPVDTSVGQLGKYMAGITEKQKHDFVDYFFGNLDPFRYLIQVDVDVPFIPRPQDPMAFAMVLQNPTAACAEMDENPGIYFADNWKIRVWQIGD